MTRATYSDEAVTAGRRAENSGEGRKALEERGIIMRQQALWLWLALACVLSSSCAFHKTAAEWNGLVGPTGDPVYLKSTTKVGFHLLVFFPFLGRTGLDGMVDEATQEVRTDGGNFIRVVQSISDNYWYALPPLTWVVTPVVHTLVVEYRPLTQPDWTHPAGTVRPLPDLYPPRNSRGRSAPY